MGGNPALLEFVDSVQRQSRAGKAREEGVEGRVQAGPPKLAQVCLLLPTASPRPPADPGGQEPDARPGPEREPRTSRGGGNGSGAGARPALTPPWPPLALPPRAPPPTCQGKERSVRAARKRRSKLGSSRAASALSSGAMAGRGGSAALPGRRDGRGAGLRRCAWAGGGASCRREYGRCGGGARVGSGRGLRLEGRSQGFGAKRGQAGGDGSQVASSQGKGKVAFSLLPRLHEGLFG